MESLYLDARTKLHLRFVSKGRSAGLAFIVLVLVPVIDDDAFQASQAKVDMNWNR